MQVKTVRGVSSKDLTPIDMPGVVAFMDDVASSDGASPITAGMFKIENGESVPYEYTFAEMKLVLDGEVTVTDDEGNAVDYKAGDLIHFEKGMKVVFSSRSSGLTFYVAQRAAA